jgi:hypothetical protein
MGFFKKAFRAVAAPVRAVANVVSKTAQGDFKGVGKELNKVADTALKVQTVGMVRFKGGKLETNIEDNWAIRGITDGIATISGAKGLQKQLDAQNASNQAETLRQATVSDALANEAGSRDDANISIGKRKKSNKVSSSAGLGGVSQGTGTGVQS